MFKQSLEETGLLTSFKTSWEEIESRKLFFFLTIISGLLIGLCSRDKVRTLSEGEK